MKPSSFYLDFDFVVPQDIGPQQLAAYQRLFAKLAAALPDTKPGTRIRARADDPEYKWRIVLTEHVTTTRTIQE